MTTSQAAVPFADDFTASLDGKLIMDAADTLQSLFKQAKVRAKSEIIPAIEGFQGWVIDTLLDMLNGASCTSCSKNYHDSHRSTLQADSYLSHIDAEFKDGEHYDDIKELNELIVPLSELICVLHGKNKLTNNADLVAKFVTTSDKIMGKLSLLSVD